MGRARRDARCGRPDTARAAPTRVRFADDPRSVRLDDRRVLALRHLRDTTPRSECDDSGPRPGLLVRPACGCSTWCREPVGDEASPGSTARTLEIVRRVQITTIASCHSPVIEGPFIEQAFGRIRELPTLDAADLAGSVHPRPDRVGDLDTSILRKRRGQRVGFVGSRFGEVPDSGTARMPRGATPGLRRRACAAAESPPARARRAWSPGGTATRTTR